MQKCHLTDTEKLIKVSKSQICSLSDSQSDFSSLQYTFNQKFTLTLQAAQNINIRMKLKFAFWDHSKYLHF